MNLLIVGAGTMGRWVARVVDAEIAFADADPSAARAAADAVDGRAVEVDTDEPFDAVCLAVPISAVAEATESYAPNADRAIFDVSGVMAAPVAAMREHAEGRERVSFHPLFAPENAPGNVAVFADESGPITDGVREDVVRAGNHVFETTVEEHDEAMETVQAGAHAAVLAYAIAADPVREEFATPVSARLEALVDAVAGGSPRVYAEIQSTFGGADAVADAARRIADADAEAFERLYAEAGERDRSAAEIPTDG
ncbi:prephenate dehydrogenase/arogenate dehydrogenase family protein [Halegenticoccus tardaugens]|uniref:prephenate dehydrogenase/arogenate dehydrogenase family protein n=1 Tax=Halegenticoccus tardaugens TaxID=2071624 RepID=UPI00100B2F7F|nr:prephenate dehydrogenase/arogenate dehydrogenase family protein [Halegenticoccus tardaugens]